jgi:hypothetical protein
MKSVNINGFMNFLNKVKNDKKEKELSETRKKEDTLKNKLKSIKEKIVLDKKRQDENVVLYDHNAPNQFQFVEVEENKLDENNITNNNNQTQIDNIIVVEEENSPIDKKERASSAYKKRNLMNFQTQIAEVLKDIKEEKTIIPKKKVNYVGLKMYLKEVLKNK